MPTVKQLKEDLKRKGCKGYSGLKKPDLKKLLNMCPENNCVVSRRVKCAKKGQMCKPKTGRCVKHPKRRRPDAAGAAGKKPSPKKPSAGAAGKKPSPKKPSTAGAAGKKPSPKKPSPKKPSPKKPSPKKPKLKLEIVIDETKLQEWEFEDLNNLLYNDFKFEDYLINFDYQSYLLKREDPLHPTSTFIFEYSSDAVEDGLRLQRMLWNLDHNNSIKEFRIIHNH
jgi:hypothetical protein